MTMFRSQDARSRRIASWLAALGLALPVLGWAFWTNADGLPMVGGVELVQQIEAAGVDKCDVSAEDIVAAASDLAVCCATPNGCFTITGQSCPSGSIVKCPCLDEI